MTLVHMHTLSQCYNCGMSGSIQTQDALDPCVHACRCESVGIHREATLGYFSAPVGYGACRSVLMHLTVPETQTEGQRGRERVVRIGGGGQERKDAVEDRNIKYLLRLTLKGNIGHVPTALVVGFSSRRSLGAHN